MRVSVPTRKMTPSNVKNIFTVFRFGRKKLITPTLLTYGSIGTLLYEVSALEKQKIYCIVFLQLSEIKKGLFCKYRNVEIRSDLNKTCSSLKKIEAYIESFKHIK